MRTTSLLAVILSVASFAQAARPEAREVMEMSPLRRGLENSAKAPIYKGDTALHGRRGVQNGAKAPIFKGGPAFKEKRDIDNSFQESPVLKERDTPLDAREPVVNQLKTPPFKGDIEK